MNDTTLRIPKPLARFLDTAAENDPQWSSWTDLARSILWEWVKHQPDFVIKENTSPVEAEASD